MTNVRGVTARAAICALLIAFPSGCGVPTESRPRAIPQDRVPAALSTPPSTPPTTDDRGDARFTVFLIDGKRLRPALRTAAGSVTPATRLEALRAGPTVDEVASGLGSALDEDTSIRISQVTGGVATLDLPPALAALVGSDQLLALAQLVFTLTEDPAIGEVIFTVDGKPVDVPVGDGTLTSRAVGRSDFPTLGGAEP